VARALAHELEREGVRTLLVELEDTLGPPSKADLARVRKAWPKR
jgi:predicted HAD superfamily phosphohydrolase YqeG